MQSRYFFSIPEGYQVAQFRYSATSNGSGVATFAMDKWLSGRRHVGLCLTAAAAVTPFPYGTPFNDGKQIGAMAQQVVCPVNGTEPQPLLFDFPESSNPQWVVYGLANATAYVLHVYVLVQL
jgi:hypothetical protein